MSWNKFTNLHSSITKRCISQKSWNLKTFDLFRVQQTELPYSDSQLNMMRSPDRDFLYPSGPVERPFYVAAGPQFVNYDHLRPRFVGVARTAQLFGFDQAASFATYLGQVLNLPSTTTVLATATSTFTWRTTSTTRTISLTVNCVLLGFPYSICWKMSVLTVKMNKNEYVIVHFFGVRTVWRNNWPFSQLSKKKNTWTEFIFEFFVFGIKKN